MLLVSLLLLAAPIALAQPAFLVKDIHTGLSLNRNSYPSRFIEVGGILFFTASDRVHGDELWRTDGTAEGTYLIVDGSPGPFAPEPSELTEFDGRLFFKAWNTLGGELWTSDGTLEGTGLVVDIHPIFSSDPSELTVMGDHLYFTASSPATGDELWRSDGTAAGTEVVLDANPGPEGSFFSSSVYPEIIAVGDTLFYGAWDEGGLELWKSDGTPGGTVRVADLNPGPESSYPARLTAVGGTVFFRAWDEEGGDELWRSDGTAAGTVRVVDLKPGPGSSFPDGLAAFGGALFFLANAGRGPEIWKTTGTGAEPLFPGGGVASFSPQFTALGGSLFFHAGDAAHGYEIWKTDGTPAGTTLVADINPGSGSSFPSELTVFRDALFFRARNETHGFELWKSDGTAAGTVRLTDIYPGPGESEPAALSAIGSFLWFTASDGGPLGFELWRSDGTAAGTELIEDLNPGAGSAFFNFSYTHPRPIDLNGVLITVADEEETGFELWRSDGTASGTWRLTDLQPGPASSLSNLDEMARLGGHVYFFGFDNVGNWLWKTDGTPADTVPVAACGGCSGLQAAGSKLFFTRESKPWVSDGTAAGTRPLVDRSLAFPSGFTAVGPLVFFSAFDGVTGYELWRTDGTTTSLVADLNPGFANSGPTNLTAFKGALYFAAQEPTRGRELWRTDGTATGTVLVKDIRPGAGGSLGFRDFRVAGNNLFFIADDGLTGAELWRTDGTAAGTVLVKDIHLGPGPGAPSGLTAVGSKLFFLAGGGTATGTELWVSDGTAAGTRLVGDLTPGPAGSRIEEMTAVGSRLLFSAWDGAHGVELWVSDGTAAGTRRVQDIAPGVLSSLPTYLTPSGPRVFFVAYQPETGRELWALPISALATPAERVGALIANVQSLGLHHGTVTSLLAKLQPAQAVLTDGDPANDGKAAPHLEAFIHHVRAQRGKKIPPEVADAWMAEAAEIAGALR
jgi:ELWxxDGT repeat protein